jgi:hypothetical protein
MNLINEFKDHGFSVTRVLNQEYSARLLKITQVLSSKLAHLPKMRPQTKHINIKYHHFREHISY